MPTMTPPDIFPISAETVYPNSVAGSRVRVEAFAEHLVPFGIDLRYRPTLSNREYQLIASPATASRKALAVLSASTRLALRKRRVEPLLIYRLLLPLPLPGVDPPVRIAVYDFDDALFVGSMSAANRRYTWLKREVARCITYMRLADLVIVGNGYLAERARTYAKRVEVVPSCVDPWLQPLRVHRDKDVLTVGWIGAPSTSGYLDEVLPAFARFNSSHLRAKLVLMGADRRIGAPWIEHRTWSLRSERTLLTELDIGIMPMPDSDWTRGKCGYKLLRYFSAGVPAIASPVGVNSAIVGTSRGVLASTNRDWQRALGALAGDWKARREMGAASRRFVEREFSYQRWAPELAGMLRSA